MAYRADNPAVVAVAEKVEVEEVATVVHEEEMDQQRSEREKLFSIYQSQ